MPPPPRQSGASGTIQLTCGCGQQLAAPPELVGKRIKCPACGQPLNITAPAAAPRVDSAPPHPAPPEPVAGESHPALVSVRDRARPVAAAPRVDAAPPRRVPPEPVAGELHLAPPPVRDRTPPVKATRLKDSGVSPGRLIAIALIGILGSSLVVSVFSGPVDAFVIALGLALGVGALTLGWLLPALLAQYLGTYRSIGSTCGLALGLLLGWTGFIIVLIFPYQGTMTCPSCAELVKPEARVCKHCGRELPPVSSGE